MGANRLYRQTVVRARRAGGGEPARRSWSGCWWRWRAGLPSLSPAELRDIRSRIESRGLLFRVRVIESQVREKEKESTKTAAGTEVVS